MIVIRYKAFSMMIVTRISLNGSRSHVRPILDHLYQENPRILDLERVHLVMEKSCFGSTQDLSQILGPDGKLKPTPLSQSGFWDPASVGGGQQLTFLKYKGT